MQEPRQLEEDKTGRETRGQSTLAQAKVHSACATGLPPAVRQCWYALLKCGRAGVRERLSHLNAELCVSVNHIPLDHCGWEGHTRHYALFEGGMTRTKVTSPFCCWDNGGRCTCK